MRIVVALGGNALLRRGQPMTAENQRENIQTAAKQIARIATGNELVVAHGNGPQVGLLSLQAAAYTAVSPYPLDVLGAETEGMIGYMIEQELGNLLPPDAPFATLLTQVEVDPKDPAFQNPTKPIGPVYSETEAKSLAAEKGWSIAPDGDKFRRVVPSPKPKRIFEIRGVVGGLKQGTMQMRWRARQNAVLKQKERVVVVMFVAAIVASSAGIAAGDHVPAGAAFADQVE